MDDQDLARSADGPPRSAGAAGLMLEQVAAAPAAERSSVSATEPGPRSPRRRAATSYRVVYEQRKGKGAPPSSRRLGRRPDGSYGGLTLPSMRAVTQQGEGQAVEGRKATVLGRILPRMVAPVLPPPATLLALSPRVPTPACPPSPLPVIAPVAADCDDERRAFSPGDMLAGRYRLVEMLGKGGMGAVWRARCVSLDLDVAIKVVRTDCWVPEASERLLREARAAARVVHPSAVRIFDFCYTAAGQPFLVMELLQGRSLSRVLADNGTFSPIAAVQIALPILGALTTAHREGIVHRDVKPSNVLLVDEGGRVAPKLIDFGIASAGLTTWARKLTARDITVGSLGYMAPEQMQGGADPDPRTDVWGACTMLYEMVTGSRPPGVMRGVIGEGRNVADTAAQPVDAQEEPLRTSAFAEHPRFWSILARGLARAPEDRWPTMSALASALAEWALKTGAVWDVTRTSLAVHCVHPPV